MKGNEIREWRARNGYASQKALMDELGIASRTTMSVLENSGDEIPRIYMLALIALERHPDLRKVVSRRLSGPEQQKFRQLAPKLSTFSSTYAGNRIDFDKSET